MDRARPSARADTLTTPEGLEAEIARLAGAGCDDLVLFPCHGALDQLVLFAEALGPTGR